MPQNRCVVMPVKSHLLHWREELEQCDGVLQHRSQALQETRRHCSKVSLSCCKISLPCGMVSFPEKKSGDFDVPLGMLRQILLTLQHGMRRRSAAAGRCSIVQGSLSGRKETMCAGFRALQRFGKPRQPGSLQRCRQPSAVVMGLGRKRFDLLPKRYPSLLAITNEKLQDIIARNNRESVLDRPTRCDVLLRRCR
jgi:hypothetical protein